MHVPRYVLGQNLVHARTSIAIPNMVISLWYVHVPRPTYAYFKNFNYADEWLCKF